MSYKPYIGLLITLLLWAPKSFSQGKTLNVSAYGVSMNYKQERTKSASNEMASNVLRIVNNTKKEMTLYLQVNPPAGWKLFGNAEKTLQLKPKDSLFVPVRVKPQYNIKGNTNYVVNAFLSSDDFTITNAIWYIAVDKISHWNVYTPETKCYFKGDEDSTAFKVRLSNNGNSNEALQISLQPEKDIELIGNGSSYQNTFPVYLKVGQDTTLTFYVRRKKESLTAENANGQTRDVNVVRSYRMKIKVTNERIASKGSNKLWTGSIDFFSLPNKTKIMEAGVESLPMTVEFNTYDMLTQSTYSSLNIYGSRTFKNNSQLNYYYQADFVQNQINLNSYLGNYLYLGYFHKRFFVELGDIGSSRPGSTLNGKGVKGGLIYKEHRLGGIFIRKPRLFEHYYAQGYGGFYTFRGKKLFVDNYYQYINNDWRKVKGSFATTDWNWQVARGHVIRFGGGYSTENHYFNPNNALNVTGYGWKLGYSGNVKKFSFFANAYYGSKDYTPLRGMFSVSGFARYRFNKSFNVSAGVHHFDYNPNIYSMGHLISDTLFNIQNNYNLRFTLQKDNNVFIIQPKYYTVNSNPIVSKTLGLAFDYRRLSRSAFKFYTSTFAGYTRFPEFPLMKDIFVAYIQSSLRYRHLQLNARYYYGPYYTIEQVNYLTTRINPQKLYSTLFYDYWFLNNRMKLNFNVNFFYNTIQDHIQLTTRPELFYYAKNGFRFSIYSRYMFYGEGEYYRKQYHAGSNSYTEELVPASQSKRLEFGAGVKFNVNMPVGFKRYYKVKVIAFRDLNGNGKKDYNEKGISDMLIMFAKNDTVSQMESPDEINEPAKVYELITNSDGKVEYDNIPVGEYVITARPLASMEGWFDGKTFYRTIDKNKTIYIPLSKGARISGGILMERARFTDNKPVILGNIRVTALNVENGKTFSTLTDKDGQFTLFAPNGTYEMIINEDVLGSRYEFLQNHIPLTVNKDFENYNVSFYLVEKERKVRMGRQKTRLPIRRNTLNPAQGSGMTKPQTPSNPDMLPLVEPHESGSKWVVQLFPGDHPRELKSAFDTLQGLMPVRCIKGQNGGYLYISPSYDKKKQAKKLLKNVKKRGFDKALVRSITFNSNEAPADSSAAVAAPAVALPAIKAISNDVEKNKYRVEISVSSAKMSPEELQALVPGITEIYEIEQDGLFKYAVGSFDNFKDAKKYHKSIMKQYKLKDSFVTQYKQAW